MKDNCNFVHLLSIVIESAINVKCSFYVIFIYLDCLDYFWDIYTFCPNVYAHVPSSFEAVIKARAEFPRRKSRRPRRASSRSTIERGYSIQRLNWLGSLDVIKSRREARDEYKIPSCRPSARLQRSFARVGLVRCVSTLRATPD